MICTDEKGKKVAPLEILNITREGGIFIKDVYDDYSKRELDSYVPPEAPKRILARVRKV
jgi:hypothetical protein